MGGVARKRGWMQKEERLRPAERSSRRGARMKAAGLIDARAIVRAADVALLRRVASTLLKGEIKTARLAKPLPPTTDASDPRPTTREEAIPRARRRTAGRGGALSEEGGSAAGAS